MSGWSAGREVGELGHYVISAATDTATIIAAVRPGYKMRVLCYTALTSAAGTLQFKSDNDAADGSDTDLTGAMPIGAGGGVSTTLNALGHFASEPDESVWVVPAGGADAEGHVTVEWVKTFDR